MIFIIQSPNDTTSVIDEEETRRTGRRVIKLIPVTYELNVSPVTEKGRQRSISEMRTQARRHAQKAIVWPK